MIAGDTQGNVWLFLNVGTKEKPELAKGKLVEADGKPIKRGSHKLAEQYAWLHMADWDADGLKDLFVGHMENIAFYKNVGTPSAPRFEAPTLFELLAGERVVRPAPYVVDWDGDGKRDLLVGTEDPKVTFYRNVGTEKSPKLAKGEVIELKGPGPSAGYRWRIDVTDWNKDGKKDLLVGNAYPGAKGTGGNLWLFLGK